MLQNYLLELHVALAKKMLHIFKKTRKKPKKIRVFPNFEGVNDKNVFFIKAKINP